MRPQYNMKATNKHLKICEPFKRGFIKIILNKFVSSYLNILLKLFTVVKKYPKRVLGGGEEEWYSLHDSGSES